MQIQVELPAGKPCGIGKLDAQQLLKEDVT
jgi:hypothetical protein